MAELRKLGEKKQHLNIFWHRLRKHMPKKNVIEQESVFGANFVRVIYDAAS